MPRMAKRDDRLNRLMRDGFLRSVKTLGERRRPGRETRLVRIGGRTTEVSIRDVLRESRRR